MKHTVLILRHVPEEMAGTLEPALLHAGLEIDCVDLFHEVPARLPLSEAAGLVVLGGPMNADEIERYPFLKSDVEWIRQAIDADLPLLGICLGAQLLAKALGSRVYRNPVKEIGWDDADLLPAAADDPLFVQSGKVVVYQSHGDTFDLPPGAVLLAEGTTCRNQAFRWGTSAYALQFHIEMTAEMIDRWLCEAEQNGEIASLPYIDPHAIREKMPRLLPDMQRFAADVFGRFAEMCLSR
jgi:GMP synthase (glutamine-hydrolysing)